MSKGVYKITEEFEESLSNYTGAPYVVTIDNACNALFLCLYYEKNVTIHNIYHYSIGNYKFLFY